MPTTSNFGWTTPADTDLVKDGAAAIRTLGNGIDTSFLDLKGGTTGQNLRKASNTDLDFTFAGDATNTVVDAAGDLLYGTAADTLGRLAIGTAGQVLKVNSGATAPEWGSATVNKNWSLVNAGGTALTGATTITVSGITDADEIMVLVASASTANTGSFVSYRFNTDTGSNYFPAGSRIYAGGTYSADQFRNITGGAATEVRFARMPNNAGGEVSSGLIMSGCNTSGVKVFNIVGAGYSSVSNNDVETYTVNGVYTGTSTISSVSVISSAGNWDAGTIYVYKTA